MVEESVLVKYILVLVFGCFCFSFHTAAWMPHHSDRSLRSSVLIFYILLLIFGSITTIIAYINRSPVVVNTRGRRYKSNYIRIGGMTLFLFVVLFHDILNTVNYMECLPLLVLHFDCDITISALTATMTVCRIVFVGEQVLYTLWTARRLRLGQVEGLKEKYHLVNITMNMSLVIYNVVLESRIVFNENARKDELCDGLNDTVNWTGEAAECYHHKNKIGRLLIGTDNIFQPVVTEFFFLTCSVLFDQWQTVNGVKRQSSEGRPSSTAYGDRTPRYNNSHSHSPYSKTESSFSETSLALNSRDNESDESIISESMEDEETFFDSITAGEHDPSTSGPSYYSTRTIPDLTEETNGEENLPRHKMHLVHFIMIILIMACFVIGLASYDPDFSMNVSFFVVLGLTMLIGNVIVSYALSNFYKIWRSVTGSLELEMCSGQVVLMLTTCGVYVYNFFTLLPHFVIWIEPRIGDEVRAIMNATMHDLEFYADHLTTFGVLEFFTSIVELSLVAMTVLVVFFIHSDRDRVLYGSGNQSILNAILTIFIIGNIAFWLFKSILFATYTETKPVQLVFYGQRIWSVIIHLINPFAIYYHFHVVMTLLEYVVNI